MRRARRTKKPRFDRQKFDELMQCSEEEKKRVTVSEDGLRINKWQYKLLKVCATDYEGIKMWNTWRKENRNVEILLEGAYLIISYLKGAILCKAHLEGAKLFDTNLEGANLFEAHLKGASLDCAHLGGADLVEAHLEGADLSGARLEGVRLIGAHLKGAKLLQAHLEGAELIQAHLEGADFSRSFVDGGTLLWNCTVDRKTKFEGVGLDSTRIYPELKQLLEYNIRRMNWQDWYKGKSKNKWLIVLHLLLTSPIRLFWWTSDYGLSTLRVILTFFVLAFIFAGVYWLCPNFIMVNGKVGDLRSLLHAVYFSVVTMTTLGFGDIAANPDIGCGQVLLMAQVLLGYVLLAALVTRFAVLFTAGGPAGKFSDDKTLRQRLFGDRTFTELFFGEQPKNQTKKRTKKPPKNPPPDP